MSKLCRPESSSAASESVIFQWEGDKKNKKQNTDTNRTDDSWFPLTTVGFRDRSVLTEAFPCLLVSADPLLTLCISPGADKAVHHKPAGTIANEGLSRKP